MSQIEKTILEYFASVPHIVSISLFGSYAENRANQASDVDIAVLMVNLAQNRQKSEMIYK